MKAKPLATYIATRAYADSPYYALNDHPFICTCFVAKALKKSCRENLPTKIQVEFFRSTKRNPVSFYFHRSQHGYSTSSVIWTGTNTINIVYRYMGDMLTCLPVHSYYRVVIKPITES